MTGALHFYAMSLLLSWKIMLIYEVEVHMKRIKIIVFTFLVTALCCGCAVTTDFVETDDYGDAGIYDLNGTLLVPYETLVKNYHFDISKDYENDENKGFSKVLQKLDLNEDVVLVVPSVSRIGEHALSYAENLAYCELPDTLETIGGYAFYSSGLREIVIPSGVSEISHNAFDSCRELSIVTLNDGLKVIDTSAFRYTPKLTEITIPETVETIGSCAFQDTGIDYVRIPDTVSVIGDNAFGNVGTVCYNGNAEDFAGFGAANFHHFNAGNVCDLCGASVDYIPYTIQGAEFIDNGVCDIPDTFERDDQRYRVVSIAVEAYKDNTDITSLSIPDSMKSIQDGAFVNCINLEQVNLNDHLEILGRDVFSGCTAIQEIVIPDQIATITGCFSGCTSLRNVTLPKAIGLSMEDFAGCDHLEKIYYRGTEEEWSSKTVGAPPPVMNVSIEMLFDEHVKIIFTE